MKPKKDEDLKFKSKLRTLNMLRTYLGKDVENARPVKVMFYEKMKHDEIIKRRGLLRGSEIWIGEDLTRKRSRQSYLARQSAKLNADPERINSEMTYRVTKINIQIETQNHPLLKPHPTENKGLINQILYTNNEKLVKIQQEES